MFFLVFSIEFSQGFISRFSVGLGRGFLKVLKPKLFLGVGKVLYRFWVQVRAFSVLLLRGLKPEKMRRTGQGCFQVSG